MREEERKLQRERERERETEIQQHFQILGKSKAMKEQSPIDCIWCHELTAVGFEPTQLALVELESTPLDHSGKLSCNTWWQWLGYRVKGVIICLTFCTNVWCLTTMSFAQVKKKNRSETIGPRIEKWTKDRLNKLGCSGNWTRDLSHPKRESYH